MRIGGSALVLPILMLRMLKVLIITLPVLGLRQTYLLNIKMKHGMPGAGLNYFSKIYKGTGATRIDRGDLYLANAMLGYKFDPNFSTQLNVNNLFDKKYYDGIGSDSMIWGEPRNATLSFHYKF